MQKCIVSVAACLILSVLGAVPARAQSPVQGNTFAISLTGLPNDLYRCETVRATVGIAVYSDGTAVRKPVLITTWVETPLGRAVLTRQSRQLRPGQTARFSSSFASPCPQEPSVGASYPLTVGLTVTIKNETLEASQAVLYHDTSQP